MDDESIQTIQMIEGVLDNVRPPLLDFIKVEDTDDYILYNIITKKNSDKKLGDNPFTNYLNSFIFCNDSEKSWLVIRGVVYSSCIYKDACT